MNIELIYLLNKWCINKNELNKIDLNFKINIYNNILIKIYISYIENNNIFIHDINETIPYYLGALLFLFSNLEELLNIDTFSNLVYKCIKISLVCILGDYAVDDDVNKINNSSELKYYLLCFKKNIKVNCSISSEVVKSIIYILKDILLEVPLLIDVLIEGLEKNGIDQTKKLKLNKLIEIESDKSHVMYKIFIAYLSNLKILTIPKELGIFSQVFDDFMDYEKDKENGINTIVTIKFDEGKHEEVLLYYLKLIDSLPDKYFVFKIVGIISLQYNLFKFKLNNGILNNYAIEIDFKKLFT